MVWLQFNTVQIDQRMFWHILERCMYILVHDIEIKQIDSGIFFQWHAFPFYQHGLTLIPVWISNHMPSEVWDEIISKFISQIMMAVIIYPFLN